LIGELRAKNSEDQGRREAPQEKGAERREHDEPSRVTS
jgi:hypothetical protein